MRRVKLKHTCTRTLGYHFGYLPVRELGMEYYGNILFTYAVYKKSDSGGARLRFCGAACESGVITQPIRMGKIPEREPVSKYNQITYTGLYNFGKSKVKLFKLCD